MTTLSIECQAQSANVKRIDEQAYGVTKRAAWVEFELGEQKGRIDCEPSDIGKLDPVWEKSVKFDVQDPAKEVVFATFGLGDKQIGDKHRYVLDALVDGAWVPKGMAVPGGGVQLQLRAHGFGKAPDAADDDAWLDM